MLSALNKTKGMKEYKVTLGAGFDRKTNYVTANSAAEVQAEIEQKFAYELEFEGLFISEIAEV